MSTLSLTATDSLRSSANPFDQIRHVDESGDEYWSARELMSLLGYLSWQKFAGCIEKARFTCANAGSRPEDHIIGSDKKVEIGSGAEREIDDFHLSRYASYLVSMNGDPRKPEIASAQTYFAVKTREAELREPRTQLEMLQVTINQMVEQERRLKSIEAIQRDTEDRIAAIEAEQERYQYPHGRVFFIMGFARLHGVKLSLTQAAAKGRSAATICKNLGIEVEKVYDPRFGSVGAYPEAVLMEVFEDLVPS